MKSVCLIYPSLCDLIICEDTDGEADHANGNNKDGEVLEGEALGGVEHVGAGSERYVPLAEKSKLVIIVAIFRIVFFPNIIIIIITIVIIIFNADYHLYWLWMKTDQWINGSVDQ